MKRISSARLILVLIGFLAFPIQIFAQLTNSKLPLVVIKTDQQIVDEPKIIGQMKVFWNGDGEINSITDPLPHYDGFVGIEIRGQSSQMFPKKGYGIELWNENEEGIDFGLLGFPEEEDFVFHGPYSDKSLMRNALAYYLASKNMDYAPRIKFFELIVNDQYVGVYLLTEKIKRDAARVNIKKIDPVDVSGDKLTGGYIMKFDKGDVEEIAWESSIPAFPGAPKIQFLYDTPKFDEIVPEQLTYIKSFLSDFETVLNGNNFSDPTNGYPKYIDPDTFIDFTLINEISRNVDGYRISTFFYKDRNSIDGRIKAGPVWDFNLGFGNANYCDGGETEGWAWDFNSVCPSDNWVIPFWWKRLLQDPAYTNRMGDRWRELRKGAFSNEKIMFAIDSMRTEIGDAGQRNFQQWPVLNTYVWPNNFIGGNYQSEITFLKTWIEDRLAWMDFQFDVILASEERPETGFKIYPNPSLGNFFLESSINWKGGEILKIYNNLGQEIHHFILPAGVRKTNFEISSSPGIYFYQLLQPNGEEISRGKLLIH